MKSTIRFLLGLASSLLFVCGFIAAASRLDPMSRKSVTQPTVQRLIADGGNGNTACAIYDGGNGNTACAIYDGGNGNTACAIYDGGNGNTACAIHLS
ncbi:MAG TPA: hypothetical protein VHE61_04935 [Opitutaceae bacterium]|nr:hypothetical protein [Opitutaceae bacterium]